MDVALNKSVADICALKDRPKYNSAVQLATVAGVVTGLLVGAVVVQTASWRV
jgi:hypothetical protein